MRYLLPIVLVLTLFGCASLPATKPGELPAICKKITTGGPDLIGDSQAANREIWTAFNKYYCDRDQRKLAVFLDGTANTKKDSTNVRMLYVLAVEQACAGNPVIPYYDKGVGNWGLLGKMVGQGASRNIRDAYEFLVEAYQSKEQSHDEIFLFGFSRGAFTARSLNGFIEFAGLLKKKSCKGPDEKPCGERGEKPCEEQDPYFVIRDIFHAYKWANTGKQDFEAALRNRIKKCKTENYREWTFYENIKVKAIGVFDTVPSLGVSNNEEPDNHRLDLYAEYGFHALSLDERRDKFRLLRFDEFKVNDKDNVEGKVKQHLSEVWFPGDHSDVGGGHKQERFGCYTETDGIYIGLDTIPLNWMLEKFAEFKIFPTDRVYAECIAGEMHDEFFAKRLLWKRFGLFERRPAKGDTFHPSVFTRMQIPHLLNPHPEREPGSKYNPDNFKHDFNNGYYAIETVAPREGKKIVNRFSPQQDTTAPTVAEVQK